MSQCVGLFLIFSAVAQGQTVRLDEYSVLPINSAHPIEPSGLTVFENKLYTVSDDSNNIYLLETNEEGEVTASINSHLDVTQLSAMNLDLEGISVAEGRFVVVSEVHHKLIQVDADHVSWMPDLGGVYADAHQAGLFQIYNAGIEAITYLGNQTFLLAAERQPRGLIEVTFDDSFNKIIKQNNQVFDDSIYPLENNRTPDLTGLYYFDGVIYALHRNAYMIHELIKNEQGVYQEGKAWSYQHIVKQPEFLYQDMQYGHAEGLAVDETYFYIVLDNNNDAHFKQAGDKRPLLIKAKRK